MMMSWTIDVTIAPNAAPMMTPTARSTTLPRISHPLIGSELDNKLSLQRLQRAKFALHSFAAESWSGLCSSSEAWRARRAAGPCRPSRCGTHRLQRDAVRYPADDDRGDVAVSEARFRRNRSLLRHRREGHSVH